MSKLQPIQLDDNTIIYIEATEEPDTSNVVVAEPESEVEQTRTAKGWLSPTDCQTVVRKSAQSLENTIRYYTTYTLNAFKQVAIAEVKKVTLEFGVNMSGVTGVPYIASGTAGCNVKVTVECVFPDSCPPQPEGTHSR
jgi:CRISPR/Cas system CMR subunit Cmr6 (Cas7 group RAMP superfamily)